MYAPSPVNAIVEAISKLYGIAQSINDYLVDLIESMKKSANKTIAQTGRVIEAAKLGFGIGYIVPVALIALGQLLLGNPLSAAATVVTSPVNPVAITCAAIGAIYYGWNALSEPEKDEIIQRMCAGLSIGAELLKAIVAFVIAKSKELLSAESLTEFKRFISDASHAFGRTVADVTKSFGDRASGAYEYVADKLIRTESKNSPLPRLPL